MTAVLAHTSDRAMPVVRQAPSALRDASPLWLAAVLAVVGGTLNALAFPGLAWWPLIFVGTPLILFGLVGRRVWASLVVGGLGGAAFWGTHIFWITIYLGPVPWLALAGLESVFFALGCALIALAWRWTDRAFPGTLARFGLTPVVIAALWTVREYVTSNWPYGGFSWGRLAFSQSESPFGELAAWVGVSGLSFLLAWVSALVVQVAREPAERRRVIRGLAPLGLIGLMLAVPAFPVLESGTLRVAAVQGNADAGLFSDVAPGQILRDHVRATEPLYGDDVDLVVWPENASDLNPLEDSDAAATLNRVTDAMNAPLITGTITTDGREMFNSLLLWKNGEGAVDQYDKKHPVPFAEYIPDRDFWYPLAPDLFSLIPRDFTIGTRDNVFDIGGVAAGLAICFDIVDDSLVREMVAGGAEIIVAPTNNADFGRTDESLQQLAIARLRAIETGRSVVNTSTVGTSAIMAPDGSTIDRLPTFEPGAMVQDVPLSAAETPAMLAGQGPEFTAAGIGIAGLIIAGFLARRNAASSADFRRRGTAFPKEHQSVTVKVPVAPFSESDIL